LKKDIHIEYENPDDYLYCMFYEIAHATGHTKRLNRGFYKNISHKKTKRQISKEEIIADFVAYDFCENYKINMNFLRKHLAPNIYTLEIIKKS